MKTTLFCFGRTAACLTLAVALLTGCSDSVIYVTPYCHPIGQSGVALPWYNHSIPAGGGI